MGYDAISLVDMIVIPSSRWSRSSKIKADQAFETSKDTYPVTRRHIPEDLNIYRQSRVNPKSPKYELQENTTLYLVRLVLRWAVNMNTNLGGGVVSGNVILYSLAEIKGAQISSGVSPGRLYSLGWCQETFGSSVWVLLQVTLMIFRIFNLLLNFWKICGPLV